MFSKLFRKVRYYLIRTLRHTGGDHVIAAGLVIGFFPCWFPTFGAGMLFSIGLARLARGNVPASILSATLGSFLWPFLFYLNYKLGELLRSIWTSEPVSIDEEFFEPLDETYVETVDQLSTLGSMGMDFLVGSVFNSILFSIAGYFLTRALLKRYRVPLLSLIRKKRSSPLAMD